MNILVTDGNSRACLAITRSLGSQGHNVFVTSETPKSIAACSRFCFDHASYPDPASNRPAFLDAMLDMVKRFKIDILLPVSDICVLPIAEHSARFEPFCTLPLADWSSINRAANKQEITDLATRLGVAAPSTLYVVDPGDVDNGHFKMPFPVVIKPSRSRVRHGSGWLYTGVDYATSKCELREKLDALPLSCYPVLLQERIPGPGIGVFYCFDRGEPIATFAHRRMHEKPPSGGVSVLRESVNPHPKANEYGLRLLRELKWHGVAMVEFKMDERDQTPKLMEINGRFWGSLQLAIDSGVDFPNLLVKIASGEKVDPASISYKTGIRSRWLWGEVDLLLLYLFKSRDKLQLPTGHDSRFVSILKTVNPFVRNQKLEVLRFSDIRPWLHESVNWFRN